MEAKQETKESKTDTKQETKESKKEAKKKVKGYLANWFNSLYSPTRFDLDSPFAWKCCKTSNGLIKKEFYLVGVDHPNPVDPKILKYITENTNMTIFTEDTFPIMCLSKHANRVVDAEYLKEYLIGQKLYDKPLLINVDSLYPRNEAVAGTNLFSALVEAGGKILDKYSKIKDRVIPCIGDTDIAKQRVRDLNDITKELSLEPNTFFKMVSENLSQIFTATFHEKGYPLETCIAGSMIHGGLIKSDLMLYQQQVKWNKVVATKLIQWLKKNEGIPGKALVFLGNQFLNPFIPYSVTELLERSGYYFQNHYWNKMMTSPDIIQAQLDAVLKLLDMKRESKEENMEKTYKICFSVLVRVISQCWLLYKLNCFFETTTNNDRLEIIVINTTISLMEMSLLMEIQKHIPEIYKFYKNLMVEDDEEPKDETIVKAKLKIDGYYTKYMENNKPIVSEKV